MLVCDGLRGLPDAVSAVWEKTIVQTWRLIHSGRLDACPAC
jgi:transposase-like protein